MKEVLVNGRVRQIEGTPDYALEGFNPVYKHYDIIQVYTEEAVALRDLANDFINVETDSKFDGVNVPGIAKNGNVMAVAARLHWALAEVGWTQKRWDAVLRRVLSSRSYTNAVAIMLNFVDGPTASKLLQLIKTQGQDQPD